MQIEIDFEVYKALTLRRQNEETTYNVVIRELLGLKEITDVSSKAIINPTGASYKGTFLPDGTQLRATYKGRTYTAEIADGVWVDSDGNTRSSPSEAAGAITKTQVNGWTFWEVRRPSDGRWRKLNAIRP
jgi:hypothetical protein